MTQAVRRRILTDNRLQAKLVLATDKSFSTVIKWAKEDDERLQSLVVIKTIKEHIADSDTPEDKALLSEIEELQNF